MTALSPLWLVRTLYTPPAALRLATTRIAGSIAAGPLIRADPAELLRSWKPQSDAMGGAEKSV